MKKNIGITIALVVFMLISCGIGYVIGDKNTGQTVVVDNPDALKSAGKKSVEAAKSLAPNKPSAAPVTKSPAPVAKPTKEAPKVIYMEPGTWEIGVDYAAGTYRANNRVSDDCYWSRSKNGNIIDNFIGSGRPKFTAKAGEEVTLSEECGLFRKE